MDKTNNIVKYVLIGALIMLLLIIGGYGVYRFVSDRIPVKTESGTTTPSTSTTNTTTPTETTTPTVPTVTTKVYFYKTPLDYYRSVDDITAFDRETTDTGVNLIQYTMDQFLLGPSTTEKASGYVLPFTLSGTSTCSGSTYKYIISSTTTLKLTICKDINPISQGEGYAGSGLAAEARVLKAITSTMKVGDITTVQVYDKTGACYAPDSGQNSCL